MDYGYTGPCRYEVRIADGNNALIGSGVLFVPGGDRYAYVFTAAHLFWYTDDLNKEHKPSEIDLSLTYAADRGHCLGVTARVQQESEKDGYDAVVILIHPKYDLRDKNSKWDAAILRLSRQSWMEEKVGPFRFPSAYDDEALFGWGYPKTMSETESDESGKADSFRESLPLEGYAKKYDEEYQEILLRYMGERSHLDLDGFSGTGLYAKPNLFFGVLSRDAGNEESGSFTWVTAWKAFEEILDAYGYIEYRQYAMAMESVNLNRQAWWLMEPPACYECGLMDDRRSINLQALLLGMTDSYTVILASVWKEGIGRSLEKQFYLNIAENLREDRKRWKQQWFELDESFPEDIPKTERTQGIVVNICADEKRPYEIIERVSDILQQRREKGKECRLIVNINAADPKIAFDALRRVRENKGNEINESIDFISAISYRMLAEQKGEAPWREADQIKGRLARMELSEMTRELIEYRDRKTAVWWIVLESLYKSQNQDEVLLGYRAAKTYHPAMQLWIGGLQAKWLLDWADRPEELRDVLSLEEIDLLCWELYLYQKECMQDKAERYCSLIGELKDYCTESTKYFLNKLINEREGIESEYMSLQLDEVSRWARTAEKEEFEQYIPSLKGRKACYWSAILNSVYGLRYVMNEIRDQRQSVFLGEILNQKVSDTKDIYQREDTEYIRSVIRRRR